MNTNWPSALTIQLTLLTLGTLIANALYSLSCVCVCALSVLCKMNLKARFPGETFHQTGSTLPASTALVGVSGALSDSLIN